MAYVACGTYGLSMEDDSGVAGSPTHGGLRTTVPGRSTPGEGSRGLWRLCARAAVHVRPLRLAVKRLRPKQFGRAASGADASAIGDPGWDGGLRLAVLVRFACGDPAWVTWPVCTAMAQLEPGLARRDGLQRNGKVRIGAP